MKRTLFGSALLSLLLALAGCGGEAAQSSTSQGSASQGAGAVRDATFSAKTLQGGSYESSAKQGTPQVLWFWAPWCTVCRAESSDVAKVAAQYADRVDFVGVAGRGKVPDMRAFVAETGTDGFEHVSDESGAIWRQFGVSSQPSFVFVDADGKATRVPGGMDAEELTTRVQSLLEG